MFTINICGYNDLTDVIQTYQPTHIISAIENIEPLSEHHLHVMISDITTGWDGHVLPTIEHLLMVLQFTQNLTDEDRLLVHCFAGQSRSTAFAIAVLIQHGMRYNEAFDHVSSLRPILLPNRLIIRLIDQHFDLNGSLNQLVQSYYEGEYKRITKPVGLPSQSDVNVMKDLMQICRTEID
jgi:predicted protein tyrosine phosphatase